MGLPLLVILLCGVFCLAPLTLYLSWLGTINRRSHPTVVRAGWDFAWLLGGLSGFLLFGGGLLVAGLQSNVRFAARGNWQQVRDAWGEEGMTWAAVALGYLLVIAGLSVLAVISRMRSLSVFHIERTEVESVIETVLTELGISAKRHGNTWANEKPIIAIDVFPGLKHVTIQLLSPDPREREELERCLLPKLASAAPSEAPVATWLYSAAISCGVTVVCCTLLIAFYIHLATSGR